MPKGRKPEKNNKILKALPSKNKNGNDVSPIFDFTQLNESGFRVADLISGQDKIDFIERIQKLSQLTWQDIANSPRHNYGYEHIPKDQIKGGTTLTRCPNERITVFRRNGKNDVMAGYRESGSHVFVILWLEPTKGDLYIHDKKNFR